jgi:lysyl-tRNA synthetase class 2
MDLDEIIRQRSQKLDSLKAKGLALYPAAVPAHSEIGQEVANFQEGKSTCLCGRVMAKRLHGRVVFLDIRDQSGKIQFYLKADDIGQEQWKLLEDVDIADIVAGKGKLFKTHTGELTMQVAELIILAKALRPLPEKWHGLKDVELRYRQRYLDLLSNEEVKKVFLARARIISATRSFLDGKGFLEVETPMMHSIAGGAAGRPFKTHHNEYDMDLFLRIAPELYLKRLLVAGLDKVYEINRSFRNEGVSTRHNPEFTMLEVYQGYADYTEMMSLAEHLIVAAAEKIFGADNFVYQDKRVDLRLPWKRVSFAELVKDKFAIEPGDDAQEMLKKLQDKGYAKEARKLTRSQVAKLIEDILEQDLGAAPTFVTDYFTSLCPLAKTRQDNPLISERFELYIAGIELANAYSELNDPLQQRKRFAQEIKELDPEEKKALDEDYLLALEHGMPPAAGLGIGIDRLVMLLTNQPAIRDVILFPLLRPEQ